MGGARFIAGKVELARSCGRRWLVGAEGLLAGGWVIDLQEKEKEVFRIAGRREEENAKGGELKKRKDTRQKNKQSKQKETEQMREN